MSFDKAIEHGKEHRREYRDSRRFDRSCRAHGTCDFCRENRQHKFRDKHPADEEEHTDA